MELEELSRLWKNADAPLEARLKINGELFKEVSVYKVRSHLRSFKSTAITELFANGFFLLFLVDFTVAHLQVKYAAPALLLAMLMLGGIGLSMYKLVVYYRINIDTPVLQAQKCIARLRYLELLEKNMLYVIIPVFSAAFLIVLAKVVLNYDLYMLQTWLIAQTAGSFLIALVVVFILKKFPDKGLQKAAAFYKELREAETQNEDSVPGKD